MSVEEKKVEAQTEKKPAGDDAVVLLGKKLEEYGKKLDGAITKMESIEQELGKVKVAAPKKEKEPEKVKEPEEVKKEEGCPPWADSIGKKLDELLKVKKEEAKKDEDEDKDEAKKKAKKTEAKKKQPPTEEDVEEEDEPWEDEDAEAKKKVKGAKVEDGESVKGAVAGSWYDEIKAASKKYFPDI